MNEEVFSYLKLYDFLRDKKSYNNFFIDHQKKLSLFHYKKCIEYKKIVDNIFGLSSINSLSHSLSSMPYIPVDLFKNYDLYSTKKENIFKILRSSGTSGSTPSKIYLDRDNANSQTISLSKIFTDFTGLDRPGMIIADSRKTISDKKSFSARAAGIIGFSYLCRKPVFALDSDMHLSLKAIEDLLTNNKIKEILLFGFTYIIWVHMLKERLPEDFKLELCKKAVLVHGGGWKKLADKNISKSEFKDRVKEYLGIEKIINYYGMVEQTGSIFMECEEGWLHTNPLCSVISRDKKTLEVSKNGTTGIAQVISSLPTSYPGNSILTDDLIHIKGIDDCKCGRKGIYFDLLGRLKTSEPRGCSDTYRN